MPKHLIRAAAYGGEGWSPRAESHKDDIGTIWETCGINSEWMPLKAVLLHTPGEEWQHIQNPDAVQMLDAPDLEMARQQHLAITQVYQSAGVQVHQVAPATAPSPNLLFCADLIFMTPEGAILARPASTVRAGEERWVARRLADLGIPIVRTLRGKAVFEGADAMWINPKTALIGRGLRTNRQGAEQVANTLLEMGVKTIQVDLPAGSMHLMGMLRFLDDNLAVGWPYRLSHVAVEALRERGFQVDFLPDEDEARQGHALNIVTLAPREILMPAGNPRTQALFQKHGVTCHTLEIDELVKAAGGIGCLTGVLERQMI